MMVVSGSALTGLARTDHSVFDAGTNEMFPIMNRFVQLATTAGLLWILLAPQALQAEVRLGDNVRIGGHDASNQTFTSQRRGEYIIYDRKPKNEGCVIRQNRDGSKTKLCRLERKLPTRRKPTDQRR